VVFNYTLTNLISLETLDEPPGSNAAMMAAQSIQFLINQVEFSWIGLSFEAFFILAALLLSALYSGSEVAFFSLVNQMDKLDHKRPSDLGIFRMLEKPRQLLATILIANTFANIVASVLAAVATGKIAIAFGYPKVVVYAIEIVVLTFMILILSEITPKVIAINNPLHFSRRLYRFIHLHFLLLTPVARLIARGSSRLEQRLPVASSRMTAEDLKAMAEMGAQSGSIHEDEQEMIENVIEFGTISVREIMTSRVNIVAISEDMTLTEVISVIQEKGLSRMPLYEQDLDHIIGFIYAKDVLPYINGQGMPSGITWKSLARKALFIPPTKKLDDLLRDFQREKTHIAIVVDEYGGTEGVVTLDDILEEIIGDFGDEVAEEEESLYLELKNGVYLFDAKIDLDDLDEILDTEVSSVDDEFETLGGLIYYQTEKIPSVGETIQYKNLECTVHSLENNRVKKVRVKKLIEGSSVPIVDETEPNG